MINPPGLVPKNVGAGRGKVPGPFIARDEFKAIEPTSPADDVLVSPPQNRLKYFLMATAIGFVVAAVAWMLIDRSGPAADAAAPKPPTVTEVKDMPNPVEAPPPVPAPAPVAKPPEPAPPPPAIAGMAKLTLSAAIPARVALDGKPLGKTPVELVVPSGPHQILFEDLGGHAKQARKIELKPNDTRTEDGSPSAARSWSAPCRGPRCSCREEPRRHPDGSD